MGLFYPEPNPAFCVFWRNPKLIQPLFIAKNLLLALLTFHLKTWRKGVLSGQFLAELRLYLVLWSGSHSEKFGKKWLLFSSHHFASCNLFKQLELHSYPII